LTAGSGGTAPESLSTPERFGNVAVEPASGYLSTAQAVGLRTCVPRVQLTALDTSMEQPARAGSSAAPHFTTQPEADAVQHIRRAAEPCPYLIHEAAWRSRDA
jgi:hypothetical protein